MTRAPMRGPGPRGQSRPGGRPGGRPRGRFAPRRRVCSFCVDHVKSIDYKNVEQLRRYISERAKIEPRRRTGVCARHQRTLRIAIQRARHLALVPFVPFHPGVGGFRS
jgi:small subunit ribosomal protein S18